MRDNPPPPNLVYPALLNQPQQGMESPPRLKRPNALQILAFEIKAERWLRGCGVGVGVGVGVGLRARGDCVQCFAG